MGMQAAGAAGGEPRAVAVISLHASPLGALGGGENGGMNLAIRRICEGLARRGVPSDVFVRLDEEGAPLEELIAPGSRLVRLPVGPPRRLAKRQARFLVDAFAAAVDDHAASEGRRYRLLHAHYWLGGQVALRLRRRWHVPWVQSFHTLARAKTEAGLPADAVRAAAEEELAGRADRLVAVSQAEGRDLVRLCRASPDRVVVAHPGVDVRRRPRRETAALRAELGLEGRRVVLYAGRLEPLKGVDVLVAAMTSLSASPGMDDVTTLLIGENSGDGSEPAGGEGGERGRLQRLADSAGLGDRFRFLGAVAHEELDRFYALADVCAVPSRTESFGFVALEAQAAGTPVVAAGTGGLREAVEDGVTGSLVTPGDPAELARHLRLLLSDRRLRSRMGEAARRRAERFTWEATVDRLLGIYDGLPVR